MHRPDFTARLNGPVLPIRRCVSFALLLLLAAGYSGASRAQDSPALMAGGLPAQAIDDLIEGRVQTHIDLPQRHPLVYAMRHEFLDALTAECGHPDRFESIVLTRELMDNVLFAYFTYGDPDLGDFSKMSYGEAYLALIGNPLHKLYPAEMIRREIASDPKAHVREVLSDLGGCDSPRTLRLRENLDAVAVMGPLASPGTTFLRTVSNNNEGWYNCFYADPDRPDHELFQPYQLATPATVGLYIIPWAAHLAPGEYLPRAHCPATPDPAFEIIEAKLLPPEPVLDPAALPEGDLATRLAAAFLDQYIPAHATGPDGGPLVLGDELRARYFDEIVRFERIEVPQDEIDRLRAARMAEAKARGFDDPAAEDVIKIATDLRLKALKERNDRGIWALIDEVRDLSGNQSANYIMARTGYGLMRDVE
ncbi:hypothetical protein [Paracoccus zhejiangensis]|nr:hypothetical protein [Paracoccus zhejiangensis]